MRDIRSDSIVGTAYLWLCRRLYHELAWSYDIVADLVSAGQWDAWRRSVLGPGAGHGGGGTGVRHRRAPACAGATGPGGVGHRCVAGHVGNG